MIKYKQGLSKSKSHCRQGVITYKKLKGRKNFEYLRKYTLFIFGLTEVKVRNVYKVWGELRIIGPHRKWRSKLRLRM